MSPKFQTVTLTLQIDDRTVSQTMAGFVIDGRLEDGGSLRGAVQSMAATALLSITAGLVSVPEAPVTTTANTPVSTVAYKAPDDHPVVHLTREDLDALIGEEPPHAQR